jgi:chromatin remodeling complex protein RSC6
MRIFSKNITYSKDIKRMAKTTTGTKTKKSTKTETDATITQVAAPVNQSGEPVSSVPETNVNDATFEESGTELLFNKLLNQFQDVQSVMKTLHSNLKVLQKEVQRERKETKKMASKKKKGTKKTLSGFAVASPITPVLADFLGLKPDEMIPRTETTSKVIAYVKANNLQNPANKKQIIPDDKLGAVLQNGSEVVTFFNLQTFLKKHFLPKPTATAESQPTVV